MPSINNKSHDYLYVKGAACTVVMNPQRIIIFPFSSTDHGKAKTFITK